MITWNLHQDCNHAAPRLLSQLRAFDDVGDGIFEPVTHILAFPFAVRSTEDASGFGRAFLRGDLLFLDVNDATGVKLFNPPHTL